MDEIFLISRFSIVVLFFLLKWDLFPLDVGLVITSGGDYVGIDLIAVVESNSWDVLGVTCHSSARLAVSQDRELVHADGSEVITSNHVSSVNSGINRVDISTISSWHEYTIGLPSEFTG